MRGQVSHTVGKDKSRVADNRGAEPGGIREGATTDDPATELGRASLTMGKPSAPVETPEITLSGAGGAKGNLLIKWENVTASAPFTVK